MRQSSGVRENLWFPACASGRFIARRNKTVPETGGWEKTMKIDLGQVQARDAEILEAAEEGCTVLLGAGGGRNYPASGEGDEGAVLSRGMWRFWRIIPWP